MDTHTGGEQWINPATGQPILIIGDNGQVFINGQLYGQIPVQDIPLTYRGFGAGQYYDPANFGGSVGSALAQTQTDAANAQFRLDFTPPPGATFVLDKQLVVITDMVWRGAGQNTTVIDCSAVQNQGLDAITTLGLFNVQHTYWEHIQLASPTATAPAAQVFATQGPAAGPVAFTTLNGTITAGTSSVTVNTGTNLADFVNGQYAIIVDSNTEVIQLKTAGGGGGTVNWSVNRAQFGTSGAQHLNGANVYICSTTYLTAGVNASTNTFPVNNGVSFPNGSYVLFDNEVVLITAGGGTTSWTVSRGQLGSSGASHAINDNGFLGLNLYTHGTTGATPATQPGYVFVTQTGVQSVGSYNSLYFGSPPSLHVPNLIGAGNATSTNILAGGLMVNLQDVVSTFFLYAPVNSISASYQYSNAQLNLTTKNYQQGSETGSIFTMEDVSWNNTSNVGILRSGMTVGAAAVFDGCEDGVIINSRMLSGNALVWQVYGGRATIIAGKFTHLGVSGTNVCLLGFVGSDVTWTPQGAGSHQFDVIAMMNNGNAPFDLTMNAVGNVSVNITGGTYFGSAGMLGWFGGTGIGNCMFTFNGPNMVATPNTPANTPLFAQLSAGSGGPPASVSGMLMVGSSGSSNANLIGSPVTATVGSFYLNRNGVLTQVLNGILLGGNALGNPANVADTNGTGPVNLNTTSTQILQFTPPIQGIYRVSVFITVKTGTNLTLTISYKDQSIAGLTTLTPYSVQAVATGSAPAVCLDLPCGTANPITIAGISSGGLGDLFATAVIELV